MNISETSSSSEVFHNGKLVHKQRLAMIDPGNDGKDSVVRYKQSNTENTRV